VRKVVGTRKRVRNALDVECDAVTTDDECLIASSVIARNGSDCLARHPTGPISRCPPSIGSIEDARTGIGPGHDGNKLIF
jgi:hypothetical protein